MYTNIYTQIQVGVNLRRATTEKPPFSFITVIKLVTPIETTTTATVRARARAEASAISYGVDALLCKLLLSKKIK